MVGGTTVARKKSLKNKFGVFDGINYFLLGMLCLLTLYPIIYVLFASISDPVLFQFHKGLLMKPIGFTIEAYRLVFESPAVLTGYKNTLFYVIVGTSINLFLTSLGAYALAQKDLYIAKVLTIMIIFTMQFKGGLIPTYYVVNQLLGHSRLTLLLPQAIITMNLIIMRTSFRSIPESLFESARIDGANDMTLLSKIVLPLSKPVMAVMALYYGVNHWNQWFQASIYLRDRKLYPLQLFLREIVLQNQLDESSMGIDVGTEAHIGVIIKYATIMVAVIPILCIYPYIQKFFVKGVMIGAIKG